MPTFRVVRDDFTIITSIGKATVTLWIKQIHFGLAITSNATTISNILKMIKENNLKILKKRHNEF